MKWFRELRIDEVGVGRRNKEVGGEREDERSEVRGKDDGERGEGRGERGEGRGESEKHLMLINI